MGPITYVLGGALFGFLLGMVCTAAISAAKDPFDDIKAYRGKER